MVTTVERIVITPATVGRWRKNLQPFSALRSFDQAQLAYSMLRQDDQPIDWMSRTIAAAPDWPVLTHCLLQVLH
jgi:hypothetical protein